MRGPLRSVVLGTVQTNVRSLVCGLAAGASLLLVQPPGLALPSSSVVSTTTSGVTAAGATPTVVALWGGARHCVILKSDGTVWDWGFNWFGKLGDGTTDGPNDVLNDRHTPIQVHGPNNIGYLASIVAIMGGESHNFAVREACVRRVQGDARAGRG